MSRIAHKGAEQLSPAPLHIRAENQPHSARISCKKCVHYKTCTKPCYPVEQMLKEKGECFERASILYPLHKQIPLSVCRKEADNGKDSANDEEKLLSTELESPFKSFTPRLKKTYVFIHRFFLKDDYKYIASVLGISVKAAENLYHEAVKKLMKQLEALDHDGREDVAAKHYLKVFRKKKAPKNKRWWLMCNYFGLTPSEVAKIEGTTGRNVSSAVCKFNAKVKAG